MLPLIFTSILGFEDKKHWADMTLRHHILYSIHTALIEEWWQCALKLDQVKYLDHYLIKPKKNQIFNVHSHASIWLSNGFSWNVCLVHLYLILSQCTLYYQRKYTTQQNLIFWIFTPTHWLHLVVYCWLVSSQ